MAEIEAGSVRAELHLLLDRIPESDMQAARDFLRSLIDPVAFSILTAPLDEEPETEDEIAEVEAARREPGPDSPHEEVLREFGL